MADIQKIAFNSYQIRDNQNRACILPASFLLNLLGWLQTHEAELQAEVTRTLLDEEQRQQELPGRYGEDEISGDWPAIQFEEEGD